MQISTLSDKCQSTQMNLDNDYRFLAENSNDKFIFMQSLKLSSYPDSDNVTLLQLQFLPNPKIINEHDNVILDREERFLGDYFNLEQRSYRWVQVSEIIALNLESKHQNFPRNSYYQYNNNGEIFREYHIDYHQCLLDYVHPDCLKYGGKIKH